MSGFLHGSGKKIKRGKERGDMRRFGRKIGKFIHLVILSTSLILTGDCLLSPESI